MPTRFVALILLALVSLPLLAVAEAASGSENASPAAGAIVAVLDTGVSTTTPGLTTPVLPGVDLVETDADADDDNGHGTAVAARIGAVCPSCRILPVRVLSSAGSAPWARVATGIVWAVDRGATVINLSIAGSDGSDELRAAVAYAVSRDVVVVASAGNRGDVAPQYPAAYEGVVGVAATGLGGRLADWSSRGSWVDLAAPGCSPLPTALGRYAWACGTSFAAPVAAGLAALARTGDPAVPASEIAAALPSLLTATHAPAGTVRVSGRPFPGSTVRATAVGFSGDRDLGERVRWFRCPVDALPHDCVGVSTGATYRVRPADSGRTLVARIVTEPFGRLWLASSARIAVGSSG